jgi:para-aminobenzoate synthetase component 1
MNFESGYGDLDTPTPKLDAEPGFIGHYIWHVVYERSHDQPTICFGRQCSEEFIQWIIKRCDAPRSRTDFYLKSRFLANTSRDQYFKDLRTISSHINEGDCYQINYTQRFESIYSGDTWAAYKQLCEKTDASYCTFLNLGGDSILCFSPELFLSVADGVVSTKPIKGTRPRGATQAADHALKKELTESKKDRAENVMIVDLLRNDLGRVCKTGTVETCKLFDVESFTNVHQLVSTIRGILKDGINPLQAFLSCFPGGSVTGAPKIKAMEIIRELEPYPRGPYCGSLFYCTANNELVSNIAIRTLYTSGNKIYCHGGGGIVADSDPEAEYEESITKVKMFMDTLEEKFLTR